jgi:Glycosyltransferase WbsX
MGKRFSSVLCAAGVIVASIPLIAADYDVAAYYFPNWHPNAMNSSLRGAGYTEWDGLKVARPRFQGHFQPSP